jgi:ankyrin repeat protein
MEWFGSSQPRKSHHNEVLIMTRKLIILLSLLLFGQLGCQKKSDLDVRLLGAAEAGDLFMVKSLLSQGVRIDRPEPRRFGWTPLHAAVFWNRTNVVQYLVDAGANVNLTNRTGETPLMMAITRGDDAIFTVQYLIDHGANLDATNEFGVSVFGYAQGKPPRPRVVEVLEAAREKRANRSR